MFELFQSNRASILARLFCVRNSEAGDPFTPLSMIVQNRELGQWLKHEMALEHGISANVDCRFLAAFLWELYQRMPGLSAPAESPFDGARLAWRIMGLLREDELQAPPLRNYLNRPGDPDLRRYQLAREIATLFDRYLTYRPEWMQQWADGDGSSAPPPHHWQPVLWRALLRNMGATADLHRAALHRLLLEQLRSGAYPVQSLPRRLSVFGLSAMPPLQLQTLEALARHIDVDMYFLNPCRHYWGDIVSDREQARRAGRDLTGAVEEDYLDAGNPILAYLGEQGREFFEMLLDIPLLQSREYFREHETSTALDLVKNDILELTFGAESDAGAKPEPRPPPDEDSLQIHSCHSPLREVEVLYDEILRLMAGKKDLPPREILVLAPDIAGYLPFVRSVFGEELPFSVLGRGDPRESPLADAFLSLLQLPESRFTGAEIVDLLNVPAIGRRHGLTATDLQRIAAWVRDTGIRWELNGPDKERRWRVPPERHNTWEFGLDRLLLGFAMTDDGVWEDILPYEVALDETPLLAGLAHFIERLGEYRDELARERSPRAWRELLSRLLEDFFLAEEDETLELDRLREAVRQFAATAGDGGCEEDVSCALAHHWLREQLSGAHTRKGSPAGGVRFADLSLMRGVPYRVVCLLGLNAGDYPREERFHSFDLGSPRNGDRRRGDWSARRDDRYLFLEALLAAEEVFYLSYVGRGLRDNQEKPASVVVTEWLHYLQALFGAENMKPVEHSLQPFNRRYYRGDRRQSRQAIWYRAGDEPEKAPVFCARPFSGETVPACESLDQLERFFVHAGRYFLQQRLGVYFNEEEIELKDAESFSLDPLERYKLADGALNCLVHDGSPEDWHARQRAAGLVTPAATGLLQEPLGFAEALHRSLEETMSLERRPRSGVVPLAGTDLRYRLEEIYGDIHLYYRAGGLGEKYLVTAWLRHLALNAGDDGLVTKMVGREKSGPVTCHFSPLDAATSRERLDELLELYRLGMTRPLPLPLKTSRAWWKMYSETADKATAQHRAAALQAATNAWNSGLEETKESGDSYWSRLLSLPEDLGGEGRMEEFEQCATALWRPLTACLKG